METAEKKKMRPEILLGIVAAFSAVLLVVTILLCLPYFGKEKKLDIPQYTPTTEEPVTEETEPTTLPQTDLSLPPPAANPYDRNDFQYDENNFLYCLAGDSVAGIDVSAHQQEIDWELVAASGIEFAYIRVAYRGYGREGRLVEDPYARDNIEGALAAGLDVGVYIFSQALNVEEALEEAEFLLEIIEGYDITLPVVYDWEQVAVETARTNDMDARTLTDCTLAFCRRVEEAGYAPMVYFNISQSRKLMFLPELTDYPFWLAWYSDRMIYPYKVKMWQYTDSGSIPGIEGPVDMNIWFEY